MRIIVLTLLAALGSAACSDDAIDSDEEARRAYLGLDESIAKSLTLGFDGFNAATSANIPPQMTTGDELGTLAITGQVDQGASTNKEMRLRVGMVDYNDGILVIDPDPTDDEVEEIEISITYDTDPDPSLQPYLQLSLRDIPTGTLTGTLTGTYLMSGDLEGEVTLDLSFAGQLQDDGGRVIRQPGTTTVTGTATSGDGVYEVTLTI